MFSGSGSSISLIPSAMAWGLPNTTHKPIWKQWDTLFFLFFFSLAVHLVSWKVTFEGSVCLQEVWLRDPERLFISRMRVLCPFAQGSRRSFVHRPRNDDDSVAQLWWRWEGVRKAITAAHALYPPEARKHQQQLSTSNREIRNLERSNTQTFPATMYMLKNVQILWNLGL